MFGDIGHGSVLLLIGVVLCLFEGPLRSKSGVIDGFLALRYIILLMGLFGTFCGLIYNDFMAIPLWIFDSCYDLKEDPHLPLTLEGHHPLKAHIKEDCVYPIGIDPTWYLGSNELTFMNSLKMKISVILGVLQMGLGVVMKAFNAVYFKNYVDLVFEFVPQIILLFVLFGYMDWLIIAKWLTDFTHRENEAPSVISVMIGMALNGGEIESGRVAVIGSNKF